MHRPLGGIAGGRMARIVRPSRRAHTAYMDAPVRTLSQRVRPSVAAALALAIVALWALVSPISAADPAGSPAPGSPAASEPPQTMCESLADLRLYVGFLRDQSLSEDGMLPIVVGVAASLSEARTLAGLVTEVYRPLVDDLVGALSSLRLALRGFSDAGSVGSGLVAIGDAIGDVGTRLDVLSEALREPCALASPAPAGQAAASPLA